MIKNAKLSGYYFYMNLNIWGNFRICISVPLTFERVPPKKLFCTKIEHKLEVMSHIKSP